VVDVCPEGCDLLDTGWNVLLTRDAHVRIRFCRKHGFARIYAITGPQASDSGWTPQTPSS
jgi:phage terminase large subunit GpA-like protein